MTDPKPEVRCFRCGRIASTRTEGPTSEEVYQERRWEAGVIDVHDGERCLAAVCCWPCFWEIEPDLWISPKQWTASDPVVPLEALPAFDHVAVLLGEAPHHYRWPESVILPTGGSSSTSTGSRSAAHDDLRSEIGYRWRPMTHRPHRPMIREVSRRENVKVSAPVLPVEHPVDRTGAPAASVMSPLPQDDLKEVRRQLEYRLSLYGKLVQRIRMALDRNNVKKAREEIRVFMTTPIKPLPPVPEPEPPRPLLTQPDAIDVVDPSAETIVEPIPDLELGDADPLLDPENGVDAEDIVPDDVPERADSE